MAARDSARPTCGATFVMAAGRSRDARARSAHLLTVVQGYLALLEDGPRGGQKAQARYLRNMQACCIQMARLISESREPRPVDLAAFVASVAGRFVPAARRRGIALEVSGPERPLRVLGHAARLDEVLIILLGNALQCTPGGGTVAVTVRPVDGEVEVAVTDAGPEIPPEEIPQLFEGLGQPEEAWCSTAPGTRFGLLICRRVIETHGGRIWAERGLGSGARFAFRLCGSQSRPATRFTGPSSDRTGTWGVMDEPLSNLDAKVRQRLRAEVRRLQKVVGITTVVLMNVGRVVQAGSPQEILPPGQRLRRRVPRRVESARGHRGRRQPVHRHPAAALRGTGARAGRPWSSRPRMRRWPPASPRGLPARWCSRATGGAALSRRGLPPLCAGRGGEPHGGRPRAGGARTGDGASARGEAHGLRRSLMGIVVPEDSRPHRSSTLHSGTLNQFPPAPG